MRCSENQQLAIGIIGFIAFAVGGSVLVYYNQTAACPPCTEGFNATMVNRVPMCIGGGAGYNQCHIEYHEPGFAIGCCMAILVSLWVYIAIGAPPIVIIDW